MGAIPEKLPDKVAACGSLPLTSITRGIGLISLSLIQRVYGFLLGSMTASLAAGCSRRRSKKVTIVLLTVK